MLWCKDEWLTCLLGLLSDLHLYFEGVEGVNGALAGCTSHSSGNNVIEWLFNGCRGCRGSARAHICCSVLSSLEKYKSSLHACAPIDCR